MNILKNLFKTKKTYTTNCDFKLCIVKDNTDLFHETLGITDKRAEEITRICYTSIKSYNEMTLCYEKILNECKHINEVVFACEMYCKIRNIKQQKSVLGDLFNDLFGHDR